MPSQPEVNFVTFFSAEYLLQGIALIESLVLHHPHSKIFVSGLDSETEKMLSSNFQNLVNFQLIQSEKIRDKIRAHLSQGRTRPEAIFSIKPMVIREAIKQVRRDSWLIYCDADLFFYSKLEIDFKKDVCTMLSEHIFANRNIHLLRYGQYNAGLVGFKNCPTGIRALEWWDSACIASCSTTPNLYGYADQKYLEEFANRKFFPQVVRRMQINQSLWAFDRSSEISQGPNIDQSRIVCFHFHGVKLLQNYIFLDLLRYGRSLPVRSVRKFIYKPYLDELRHAQFRNEVALPSSRLFSRRFISKILSIAFWRIKKIA